MRKQNNKLIEKSVQIARRLITDEFKEHFIGIYLNQNKKIIHKEIISIGTLTASIVHPREIFKPALKVRACYIIVLHNHPSGILEASREDLRVTEQLVKAGEIMGIPIINHVIFTSSKFYQLNLN